MSCKIQMPASQQPIKKTTKTKTDKDATTKHSDLIVTHHCEITPQSVRYNAAKDGDCYINLRHEGEEYFGSGLEEPEEFKLGEIVVQHICANGTEEPQSYNISEGGKLFLKLIDEDGYEGDGTDSGENTHDLTKLIQRLEALETALTKIQNKINKVADAKDTLDAINNILLNNI